MAGAESKRFYLALLVWAGAFLLGLGLARAGLIEASVQAMTFSFVLGVVAIFVFFRTA